MEFNSIKYVIAMSTALANKQDWFIIPELKKIGNNSHNKVITKRKQ